MSTLGYFAPGGLIMRNVDPYRWYSDPGHGWLRVPLDETLGFAISSYSYIDRAKGFAYLEEDCDAPLWLRAKGLLESAQNFREFSRNSDSPIRKLARFPG